MKGSKVLALVVVVGLAAAAPLWAGGACCSKDQLVTKQVANLPNGVKITLTASDPKVVAQLQSKTEGCGKEGCKTCPMHAEGVTRTVEKIANGVVITATSADAQLVAALQKHASGMTAGCNKSAGKASCCSKGEAKGSGCSKGASGHAHPTT
ncbi:MAG: hypothetical protein ACK42L_08415 [Thermoanaerobaculum sp.]